MNNVQEATANIQARVLELLSQHQITMSAKFVPFSISRNRQEKHKSLNWIVDFTRPHPHQLQTMSLEYSQGIAHVPSYVGSSRAYDQIVADKAAESGVYHPRIGKDYMHGAKPLPQPHAADVLNCIVMELVSIDQSFEDWCSELGYDSDSRKAEAIYDACRKQSRDAMRVFGEVLLKQLQQVLQEY